MNLKITFFSKYWLKFVAINFLILSSFFNMNASALSYSTSDDSDSGLESSISERLSKFLFDSDDEKTFADQTTEDGEVGSVRHQQLIDIAAEAAQPSEKYLSFSWWMNVLASAQAKVNPKAQSDYKTLVFESLTQNGYVSSDTAYDQEPYERLRHYGLATFKKTFYAKLDEFERAQKDYFGRLVTQEQRTEFEKFRNDKSLFYPILQKKQDLPDTNYNIVHCGDLHGDLIELLTLLKFYESEINDDFSLKNRNRYFVFSGDYIDRCYFGLEILYILMSLKIKNPDNVFLLLGNHESEIVGLVGFNLGFPEEVAHKFKDQYPEFMNLLQVKMLKYLPVAFSMMTEYGHILFCHGLPYFMDNSLEEFLRSELNFCFYKGQALEYLTFSELSPLPQAFQIPESKNLRLPQSIDKLAAFMQRNSICICCRGHQHNDSIRQIDQDATPATGMVVRSSYSLPGSAKVGYHVFTTTSVDFSCCYPGYFGIGEFCHFCSIIEQNKTLTVEGLAVNRLTPDFMRVTNPLQIQKEQINPLRLQFLKDLGYLSIDEAIKDYLAYFKQYQLVHREEFIPSPDTIHCNIDKLKSVLSNVFKLDIPGICQYLFDLGFTRHPRFGNLVAPQKIEVRLKVQIAHQLSDKINGVPAIIEDFHKLRVKLLDQMAKYITSMPTEPFTNSGILETLAKMKAKRVLLARSLMNLLCGNMRLDERAVGADIERFVGTEQQVV